MPIRNRMADQLRPYIDGSGGPVHGEDNLEEEADYSVPLLTVSDINPEMLEVRYKKRGRAKLFQLPGAYDSSSSSRVPGV